MNSRPTFAEDRQCVTAGHLLCSTLFDVISTRCLSAFVPLRLAFTTPLVLTHIYQNTLDFCLILVTHRRGGLGWMVQHQVNVSYAVALPSDGEEAQGRCSSRDEGGGSSGCWGSTGAGAVPVGAVGLGQEGSHIYSLPNCCLP